MSLQNIDARISKIEQRVAPPVQGKAHLLFEADPDVGARKAAEMEATLPENDFVVLITSLRSAA